MGTFGIFRKSWIFLNAQEQKRYFVFVFLQMACFSLDVLGLIGLSAFILGALSNSKLVQNSNLYVNPNIENLSSFITQNLSLYGLLLTIFFIFKAILSSTIVKRTLLFLAKTGANISSDYYKKLLTVDLDFIERKKMENLLISLTNSINFTFIEILGAASIAIADAFVITFFLVTLLIVNPWITLCLILLFSLVGFLLYRKLSNQIFRNSRLRSMTEISSRNSVRSGLNFIREIQLNGLSSYFADEYAIFKSKHSKAHGISLYLQQLPKFILDVVVTMSFLLISIISFRFYDSERAIALISFFILCISRLIPSLLRIQSCISIIGNSQGYQHEFVELRDSFANLLDNKRTRARSNEIESFDGIQFVDLSYTYQNGVKPTLNRLNLRIPRGQKVALIGPSGCGKSTLLDLLLGFRNPDSGFVWISDLSPQEFRNNYPHEIGYVPQNSQLLMGTFLENLTLKRPANSKDIRILESLVNDFGLKDELNRDSDILSLQIGGIFDELSGGQRQKIALIRAMFLKPRILILDEAMSALDAKNESRILHLVNNYMPDSTVVSVVHNLKNLKDFDFICYLEEGTIVAQGSYTQMLKSSEAFSNLIKLHTEPFK